MSSVSSPNDLIGDPALDILDSRLEHAGMTFKV